MHCITTNLREMDEVAKMCVLLCHIIITKLYKYNH